MIHPESTVLIHFEKMATFDLHKNARGVKRHFALNIELFFQMHFNMKVLAFNLRKYFTWIGTMYGWIRTKLDCFIAGKMLCFTVKQESL